MDATQTQNLARVAMVEEKPICGMSDLVLRPSTELSRPVDADTTAKAHRTSRRALSASTVRAYAGDWARFELWCRDHGKAPMPAEELTIQEHLIDMAKEGLKYATLARTYAAIRSCHRAERFILPPMEGVAGTLHALGMELGVTQDKKFPLRIEELRKIVEVLPVSLRGVRDRAMLLFGFAIAGRQSEIVAANVDDLTFEEEGVVFHMRRSKTDQKGVGREVGIANGVGITCPRSALEAWISFLDPGPLFRPVDGDVQNRRLQPREVDRAVKRSVALIGLDPEKYGGHSLRAGLVTSAAEAGKSLDVIMETTGHKSERVAMGYIRRANLFKKAANNGIM